MIGVMGVSDDTVLKLKQKITDILVQTEAEKVDIVAHSTGGLIVKICSRKSNRALYRQGNICRSAKYWSSPSDKELFGR